MNTLSFKALQAKANALINIKEALIPHDKAASFINDLNKFWVTTGFKDYPLTYADIIEYLNEESISEQKCDSALSWIASHTDECNDTITNIAFTIVAGEGDSDELHSQDLKEDSEAFRARNCEEDFAMFPEEHEGEYF